MVPKLNYVLMVVLTLGLLTVVTALALPGPKVKPLATDAELTALINRLGNDDSDIVREARHDLINCGTHALPQLKLALTHENKQIRDQAKRTMDVIEGRVTEDEIEP
jgi:hypothetical protein